MARINGVPAHEAAPEIARTYDYAKRALAQLTGREPEHLIEPLELYAHAPGLLQGILTLEGATATLNRLPVRLSHLAQLKAATLTSCEYCIDLGSQIVRRSGLQRRAPAGAAPVPRERPLQPARGARPRLRRGHESDSRGRP
jgi:alkylhydroperoxidase family enzyme